MPEVTIDGASVVFPPICPACLMPATKVVPYRKSVVLPGLRQWVQFNISYCNRHADILAQSEKRLRIITMSFLGVLLLLWAAAGYGAILVFPELKIIPGDSILVWVISIVLAMCVVAILGAMTGAGI